MVNGNDKTIKLILQKFTRNIGKSIIKNQALFKENGK